jgi:excinuclease ABC subunit B
MEGTYGPAGGTPRKFAQVAEEAMQYAGMKPEELSKTIKELEQQMFKHAQDLEFEEAARLRDQIHRMREQNMELMNRAVGQDL